VLLRRELLVNDIYKLENDPQPENDKYKIRVLEFEREHSFLSDFNLIKITHPKKLNINVLYGNIIAYNTPILPTSATNKKGEDILEKISNKNGDIFFDGKKGDVVNIRFDNLPNWKNYHLIFKAGLRANYPRIKEASEQIGNVTPTDKNWKKSVAKIATTIAGTYAINETIHPDAINAKTTSIFTYVNNKRKPLLIIHPREKLSFGFENLSEYITDDNKSITIRMRWTASHHLSFVGISEVTQIDSLNIKRQTITPTKISHSENKEVNLKKLKNTEVEITPGQFVELEFPAEKEKNIPNQKTSLLLESKGYYMPYI